MKIKESSKEVNATVGSMRGMSEPYPFSFSIVDKKGNRMVVHAVVFTSFEMNGHSQQSLNLGNERHDPRMNQFINYVFANYLKEKKAYYDKAFAKVDVALAEDNRFLSELQKQIDKLQEQINEHPQST